MSNKNIIKIQCPSISSSKIIFSHLTFLLLPFDSSSIKIPDSYVWKFCSLHKQLNFSFKENSHDIGSSLDKPREYYLFSQVCKVKVYRKLMFPSLYHGKICSQLIQIFIFSDLRDHTTLQSVNKFEYNFIFIYIITRSVKVNIFQYIYVSSRVTRTTCLIYLT